MKHKNGGFTVGNPPFSFKIRHILKYVNYLTYCHPGFCTRAGLR